jgi:hypothetical protein
MRDVFVETHPGMPFRRRLASVALRDELYRKASKASKSEGPITE